MKANLPAKKATSSNEAAQRILRKVPNQEGFYFARGIGDYTGQVATCLADFAEILLTVDSKSVEFHMERRDFERWIRNVFGDEELAQNVSRTVSLLSENHRNELVLIATKRLDELRKMQKTK